MRKLFLTALCAMSMVVGMTGCGTNYGDTNSKSSETEVETEADNIVGTWNLKSVTMDGITHVESSYLDAYDYGFTFSEDGSAVATVLGVSYETTYEVREGWITFAEADLASIKLEIDGDNLKLQLNIVGGGLIFERQ